MQVHAAAAAQRQGGGPAAISSHAICNRLARTIRSTTMAFTSASFATYSSGATKLAWRNAGRSPRRKYTSAVAAVGSAQPAAKAKALGTAPVTGIPPFQTASAVRPRKAMQASGAATCLIQRATPKHRPMAPNMRAPGNRRSSSRSRAATITRAKPPVTKGANRISVLVARPPGRTLCAT